jgi:hypothetical protein
MRLNTLPAYKRNLLSTSNAKTMKGEGQGFKTFILYMAPANTATKASLCPYATSGCKSACLYTAGRGVFDNVKKARCNKAELFENNRDEFMALLVSGVERGIKRAKKAGYTPVFRLNGTSDVCWERIPVVRDGVRYNNVMEAFSGVQFYDYTKFPEQFRRDLPMNYDLTFSVSETPESKAEAVCWLQEGRKVAAVISSQPAMMWNAPVINGDDDDLTFAKPAGVVLRLKPKGKARKDTSGFVIHV